MLMGRRGGYVMAGDVCVICSAPSGSSVINLANQTNPDINYLNLIVGPSNLNTVFKHTQYFILPKYYLLCSIYAKSLLLPMYVFVGRFMRADTELDFCYAKIPKRIVHPRPQLPAMLLTRIWFFLVFKYLYKFIKASHCKHKYKCLTIQLKPTY